MPKMVEVVLDGDICQGQNQHGTRECKRVMEQTSWLSLHDSDVYRTVKMFLSDLWYI